jgi:hypothetical protein
MKRSRTQKFAIVAVTLIALTVVVRWLYGTPPYVQVLKLIHSDIPRQVVPVELVQGRTATFQTRIVQSVTYDLNLLVYFDNREQRAQVDNLIGTDVARPGDLTTVVRIVVHDEENRTIYDQTLRAKGVVVTTGYFVGRRLDRLPLKAGVYKIDVVPLSDMSRIASFRTALELYHRTK